MGAAEGMWGIWGKGGLINVLITVAVHLADL